MFSFEPRCRGLRGSQKVDLDVGGNREALVERTSLCLDPQVRGHRNSSGSLLMCLASAATTVVVSLRGILMSIVKRVLRSTR